MEFPPIAIIAVFQTLISSASGAEPYAKVENFSGTVTEVIAAESSEFALEKWGVIRIGNPPRS